MEQCKKELVKRGEKWEGARKKRKKRKLGSETESMRAEESEERLVNMITVCAAAHPCAKLVRSDNRALWGTLFMLFIWQHTEKKAESCLDSIKKCSVVCIMYLYLVMGGESVFVVIKQHLHHRIFCLRKRGKKLIFFLSCFFSPPMFKRCQWHLNFSFKWDYQEFNQ